MDNFWCIKRFSSGWNSFICRWTAPTLYIMHALYCPSPGHSVGSRREFFQRVWTLKVNTFREGRICSASPQGSVVHFSILGQFKHCWVSTDQFLQPPYRCGYGLMSPAKAPGWNKGLLEVMTLVFFFLLLPCVPESFCENTVISVLPFLPAPLLGLEKGEAEEIFYGPWITGGRTAYGGQKKTSLQGAKRLVLGREGVRKMLRSKWVHKNWVEISRFFHFCLYARSCLRPVLSPMSFIYTGSNLKSRKKTASLKQIPPVHLRSPQQSRTAWNKGGSPTRKIQ